MEGHGEEGELMNTLLVGLSKYMYLPFSVKVFDTVLKRQTMANLAKDMDTWIEKRDQLSRKIDELKKQKCLLLNSEVRILCA